MHIIVVHGENSNSSYLRLTKLVEAAKKRNFEVLKITNQSNIIELFSSQFLFDKQKISVIEEYDLLRAKEIKWLNNNKDGGQYLIIYHDDVLPKSFLDKFKKIDKIEEYKLAENVFKFLESFYPRNYQKFITMLHTIVQSQSIEFVFSLLAKQLRDLYWVKSDASNIPYPSWRVNKLENQAARFEDDELKNIINQLAILDIKSKTTNLDLLTELDLMFLTKIQ